RATQTERSVMQKHQRTVDIKAPAQRVYDFVAQPRNLPGVWPSMVAVSNVVAGASGGYDFDWEYKMAGVHLKGHTKVEEDQPGKLFRTRTEGTIESTFRWTFRSDGAGMKLSCEVEYTIPVPVLGKLAEVVVAKINEREMETTLANIKDVMEHAKAGVATGAHPH
ncbi:MAG: SRPBCC family protein, partial [Thermoanaerobaculia bacterium]